MKLTALLSIVPAVLLVSCTTTASSVTAVREGSELPANYRQQIAAYMKTQMFARNGISGAEISNPNRTFAGWFGERDVVCVRIGGSVRLYMFSDGKPTLGTGGIISESGAGVLSERWACGENPTFKPFPEANYQP